MSIRNNTVGTTEITPVETEVTKSKKQESRDFSRGRFKEDLWTLLDLGADEGRFKNGYDELIDYVEKWSKDNPLKTRQEVLVKRFPYQRLDADGLSPICPRDFDTRIKRDRCDDDCHECRKKYWTSPADEEDQDE